MAVTIVSLTATMSLSQHSADGHAGAGPRWAGPGRAEARVGPAGRRIWREGVAPIALPGGVVPLSRVQKSALLVSTIVSVGERGTASYSGAALDWG
jgi:hypothetical protein